MFGEVIVQDVISPPFIPLVQKWRFKANYHYTNLAFTECLLHNFTVFNDGPVHSGILVCTLAVQQEDETFDPQ